MKNFYSATIIVLFLFPFSNGIIAQTSNTKPEKVELMKQYPDLLKTPAGDKLKSASAISQLLDSTIWEQYDSAASQVVVHSKTVFTYDANGNTSTDILYYYINSAWIETRKDLYNYDDKGNMTSDIYYYFDETSNWNWYEIREYTYDDKGNVILDITYTNEINLQIKNGTKHEYTYDSIGNITVDIRYVWNVTDSLWVNNGKSYLTYDADGNRTSIIFYYWGKIYDWDTNPPKWILNYKGEFTFDHNGDMILGIDYYWNYNTGWVSDQKIEYTYDTNGNLTSAIVYYLVDTNQYNNYFKFEYTYDINGNMTSYIYYLWYESSGQWIANAKNNYYYSEHDITSAQVIPEREIKVYPNPASEYVLFDLSDVSESATVELYDIQGKKVLEQKLSDNKQISVSNLSTGLYMYRLNDSGFISKGKILVE